MKILPITLLIICVCLTAEVTAAQEPMPAESGFSGYIEILGAFISSNSQLNTDRDNKKTDSLDTSGERVNNFKPLPLGLLSYTFAERRTQLFMGVLPENVAQGQFFIEAGARHILRDGTGLRASLIPLTPIEPQTWKDPFVVGQNRQRTDIESYGFKLAAETLFGSGLSVKYGWVRKTIDAEKSGTFLLSQPDTFLTPNDLNKLDRDAHFHRFTTQYSFQIGPRLRLTSILRYIRSEASGDANSFHSLIPELSFTYFGSQLQSSINLSAKNEWYDSRHPVFDKIRREFKPGLFAVLGYKEPFGLKKFRIDWFNAFFKSNSNIDFYESSSFITALGLGYVF